MGTPVPDEWPELVDGKWYCILLHQFGEWPWDMGCAGPFISEVQGCILGQTIKTWLDNGWECDNNRNLLPGIPAAAQRLVAVHGPYDTGAACGVDCY
ncbi:hypothetical protein ES703_57480 [subsurface metagenome]